MNETRVCDNCLMEFDWPGVTVETYEYCCEACSRGEECTCPQHNHQYEGTTSSPSRAHGEQSTTRASGR